MRTRSFFLVAVSLMFLSCEGTNEPGSSGGYFPSRVGDYYVYEMWSLSLGGSLDTITYHVRAPERFDGEWFYRYDMEVSNGDEYGTVYFRYDGLKIYFRTVEGETGVYVDFGAKHDSTQLAIMPLKVSQQLSDVALPAGIFKQCLEVRTGQELPGREIYAAGVGRIFQELGSGQQLTLISGRIAGRSYP